MGQNLSSGYRTKQNSATETSKKVGEILPAANLDDTSKMQITKGPDQSVHMCRLVCNFAVPKPLRPVFLHQGQIMFLLRNQKI